MNPKEAVILGVFVLFILILIGTVGSNTMGTIANSTITACKNCSGDSKTLLANVNVFYIFLILASIIGGVIVAYKMRQ